MSCRESKVEPAEKNPEVVFAILRAALSQYVTAKERTGFSSAGSKVHVGISIPTPDHDMVDEIARHLAAAFVRSEDDRTWRTLPTSALSPGDVFVRYDLDRGKPIAEEVTVVGVGGKFGRVTVRFSRPSGAHGTLDADADYLFQIHRPSKADLRETLHAELKEI